MLDPVADKILMGSTYVCLTWAPGLVCAMPVWLTVVLLFRDAVIVMAVALDQPHGGASRLSSLRTGQGLDRPPDRHRGHRPPRECARGLPGADPVALLAHPRLHRRIRPALRATWPRRRKTGGGFLIEAAVVDCPWCGETIDLSVDTSIREQTYYEDCQVCCRPMQVRVRSRPGEVLAVEVSE